MPIYMDYHIFDEVTTEQVKQAHLIDKKTQDKYEVIYHQFWVNEKAGTVFCLIEGPNADACEAVHREAHGDVSCNIIEVEAGLLNLFMGKAHSIADGVVYNRDGSIDSGFRYILVLDIVGKTDLLNHANIQKFVLPEIQRNYANNLIKKFDGQAIKNLSDDSIIATFKDVNIALECAIELQSGFLKRIKQGEWDVEFRIGLGDGQPVTMKDGFFEEAVDFSKNLSLISDDGTITISNNIKKLSNFDKICGFNEKIKIVSDRQKDFAENFFKHTQTHLANSDFSIISLSAEIGVSRTQLYRKTMALTGRSPISFIRDIKMHKARNLIKRESLNISEIALEVGFNSPSYFSKCFQDRYGIVPSKMI
jgi:AraC-like DNA-binding protein